MNLVTKKSFISSRGLGTVYKKNRYYFKDGLVGKIPKKVYGLIARMNKPGTPNKSLNRLILYGPPGNGKSTIAKKIAELTDGEFISAGAPSIVGKYLGQGVSFINGLFEDALKKSAITDKRVIIFIDEIDAIATFNSSELKSAHTEALQALWLNLDKYKDNANIFVVCATNEIEKIHPTFLDRFGNNLIEIKNPDLEKRIAILRHYLPADSDIDFKIIKNLAKKCSGLSGRSLEDLATEAIARAEIENAGVITSEILWSEYYDLSKKQRKIKRKQVLKGYAEGFIKWGLPTLQCISVGLTVYQMLKKQPV